MAIYYVIEAVPDQAMLMYSQPSQIIPLYNFLRECALKIDVTRSTFSAQNALVWRPGSAGPAGGAYSALPGPLAGFEGPTSKGRRGAVSYTHLTLPTILRV